MFMQDNSVFVTVKDPNLAETRTMPAIRGIDERKEDFDVIEATYTAEEAASELARCLKCPTHWCQKACPAGVPVTDFIALARAGEFEEAYRLIRTASTMPEICSRVCPQEKQCQSNCTRAHRTQAVGIGKLERYVVEQHYASGAAEPAAPSTGKRVAVVGSGPAGLSAAQRLVDLGHSVIVYEKAERAGGLLMYGIPNMKLDKNVVARKVASLEAQGVIFRTGVNVGVDVTAEQLSADHDAVILAVGTGNARTLKLEGADQAAGILMAPDFLSSATRAVLDGDEPIVAEGRNVVIVGGGDTGNDCVGTALREGAKSITQIEMLPRTYGRTVIHAFRPARPAEQKHDFSQEECAAVFGDPHVYQTTIKAVQTNSIGQICSVTTIKLEPVYDAKFRISMQEIPGTEKTIPCDLLIIAAGFIGPETYVAESFSLTVDDRSNLIGGGKIFPCGDCRTGQSLVVKAMADGRDCADAVNAYLNL